MESTDMLWMGTCVTLVTGIIVIAVIRAKRTSDVDDLGSVSQHWVAEHRVDAP